ncbi:Ig-like domain-containing protein, partial [Mycobacterium sp. NPDC003323]
MAVATTPGVAFATTDTDSDSQAGSSNDSSTGSSAGSSTEKPSSVTASESTTEDDPDQQIESPDDATTDDESESSPIPAPTEEVDEEAEGDDEDLLPAEDPDNSSTETATEPEVEVEPVGEDGPVLLEDTPEPDSDPQPAQIVDTAESAAEEDETDPEPELAGENSEPVTQGLDDEQLAAFTTAPTLNTRSLNPVDALLAVPRTLAGMISGAISTVLSPLLFVGSGAPVQTPLLWTVLAWVRREIVHTFFNRTPQVNVEQVVSTIPGVVIFDLNETDPNCDPLTTTIVGQPEHGTIIKNIDGTFTYTVDVDRVVTGVTDSFTIRVTDSVGTHLPGVLGAIQNFFHRVAQWVGLAKPDTIDVTVPVTIPGIGVDVPPVLVVSPTAVVTAGDSVVLSPGVFLTDPDSTTLSGATVTIAQQGSDPSDLLSFTASDGITGSFANGVLTLSGDASIAAYKAVLQSVALSTNADGLIGLRTVTWTVVDPDGTTSLPGVTEVVVIGELNAPPTVVASPVGVVTVGGSTVVSPVVVIVNEPGENLSGATVSITLGGDPSDVLTFTPSGGITGSYEDGVLTLTGTASAAAYQAVLQSVSFSTDASGLVGVRTIEFEATDANGQTSLLPGITALTVVGVLNGAPTIVATPVGVVTAGQSTTVSPIIAIVNDPGENLSGATVSITLGGDPSDVLTFTPSGGITGSYEDGVLTLSGSASAATYQAVLQSVSFSTSASGLVGVRTIEFEVTDAAGQTSALPGITALTVLAIAVNVPPTVVTTPV